MITLYDVTLVAAENISDRSRFFKVIGNVTDSRNAHLPCGVFPSCYHFRKVQNIETLYTSTVSSVSSVSIVSIVYGARTSRHLGSDSRDRSPFIEEINIWASDGFSLHTEHSDRSLLTWWKWVWWAVSTRTPTSINAVLILIDVNSHRSRLLFLRTPYHQVTREVGKPLIREACCWSTVPSTDRLYYFSPCHQGLSNMGVRTLSSLYRSILIYYIEVLINRKTGFP